MARPGSAGRIGPLASGQQQSISYTGLTRGFLVGAEGFEPVTSAV